MVTYKDYLFIVYPAFRFQFGLQDNFMGKKFWDTIYKNLKQIEKKEKQEIEFQKYQEEEKKKRQV